MEVSLQEILAAREQRAAKQQALLQQYGVPVICFTMNIAGPEKCNDRIQWGFQLGCRWLKTQLADLTVLHSEEHILNTGCEGYYAVDASVKELKLRTVQIEDSAPVARLFDMDVLDCYGKKAERTEFGYPQRKCLLCDQPAHICGRSRAHSVEQLQRKTAELLEQAMVDADCSAIAQAAQKSLLYEVCTTPKPGLVDCRNNGSHEDMDIFTFMDSAAALVPYFTQCAKIGSKKRNADPQAVFQMLRFPGKLAEQAMLAATGGVNTHKGAIFSLGILCAATGYLLKDQRNPENILQLSKEMTQDFAKKDFAGITAENAKTTGEKLYAQYGITGVRGQAEAGFPAVLDVGLPVLEEGLKQGICLNDAGCAALLALLSATTDTNLIHRSNLQTQQNTALCIRNLLEQTPYPTVEILKALDDDFIKKNLSPGGSADLLALTFFLHFIKS